MNMKFKDGYNKEKLLEPLLIWEPEDWTAEEWTTLCKVCGLPPERTERIVLTASQVEFFIVDPAEKSEHKGGGRTYTVTELCPHCENEIEMQWDTDRLGYKAFCPVCGERLMLCNECQHSGPDGGPIGPCDYDRETDTCRFNPRKVGFQPGDTVYVVERNEFDQPVEVSGYMFIVASSGFVIVSPFICALETAEDTLDCQARNTQYDFSADLRVYRKVDCFATPEEAHDVLKVARGEGDV